MATRHEDDFESKELWASARAFYFKALKELLLLLE